jgi:glycosyltransferase involved in cell wall biosynthesis
MRAAGVFPRRLRHVPHFIESDGVPVKTSPGGGVLVAGRLSSEKGVDVAIRAIATIEGAVIDIAGTGPEEESLRRLAGAVAPGRVRFHGLLDKDAVQRLMLATAVVVVPSRWYENQPMVVLEALSRGVPVVGSALGGMPELIDPGSTGDLVPADDPGALAAALRPYLSDPDRGFAMRHNARAKVLSEFSPSRHLERIHQMYDDASIPVRRRAA